MIGQAQTGTGKTAAFVLPFLNRWRPHKLKGPIGLVMTPTRELALQVAKEVGKARAEPAASAPSPSMAGPGCRSNSTVWHAAATSSSARRAGCSTTFAAGRCHLDHVRYVVLDEADRMLDIGFRPDIERILKRCPLKRQTLLMSATVPDTDQAARLRGT